MSPFLDFLLCAIYNRATLHPKHLADLKKSGLTDKTIARQKISTVPPGIIDLVTATNEMLRQLHGTTPRETTTLTRVRQDVEHELSNLVELSLAVRLSNPGGR